MKGVLAATLLLATSATATTPDHDGLASRTTVLVCERLLDEEIARRSASLGHGDAWTIMHQALWRLGAEHDVILSRLAQDGVMPSRTGLRKEASAAMPDGLPKKGSRAWFAMMETCGALAIRLNREDIAAGRTMRRLPPIMDGISHEDLDHDQEQ